MAAGDFVFFAQFKNDVLEKLHDLENDTFKLGHITDAVTPTATAADPRWGSGGTTDYSANEVTPGGNYTAGGPTVPNPTVTISGADANFDAGDVDIAQDGSNPTNSRWNILYNDTDSGKRAVGFLDLGAVSNLSTGPFDLDWDAAGIANLV